MLHYFIKPYFVFVVLLCACSTPPPSHTPNSPTSNTSHYIETIKLNLAKKAAKEFTKGQFNKAETSFSKLLQENPINSNYLLSYAESLRLSGKTKAAIKQYNRLISNNTLVLPAKEGKGLALIQDGELKKAHMIFNDILQIDASKWRTVNALGVISSLLGENEEAELYFNMASTLSQKNPSILNNIGLSVALSGDTQKGLALLNKALNELESPHKMKERLEHNIALIYGISGKMDKAQAILKAYLNEAAVYNNLAFYSKLANDKQLAQTYLSKSLSSSPVHYEKAWKNLQQLKKPSQN